MLRLSYSVNGLASLREFAPLLRSTKTQMSPWESDYEELYLPLILEG